MRKRWSGSIANHRLYTVYQANCLTIARLLLDTYLQVFQRLGKKKRGSSSPPSPLSLSGKELLEININSLLQIIVAVNKFFRNLSSYTKGSHFTQHQCFRPWRNNSLQSGFSPKAKIINCYHSEGGERKQHGAFQWESGAQKGKRNILKWSLDPRWLAGARGRGRERSNSLSPPHLDKQFSPAGGVNTDSHELNAKMGIRYTGNQLCSKSSLLMKAGLKPSSSVFQDWYQAVLQNIWQGWH